MLNGHLFHLKLNVFIISCSCLLRSVRDCESGCKSCITRSAGLKISTQNTSVTYSRARQGGEAPPPPGLVAATNSAMSAPAPAIRWKQFIRERERRDASSELLSLDLISVPAIPGNSAQGHWVSRCSCFRLLTPDHNIITCSWPRVSPAAHSGL